MRPDVRPDLKFNLFCQRQYLAAITKNDYDVALFRADDYLAIVYVDILRQVIDDSDLESSFFDLLAMYLNSNFISDNAAGLTHLYHELSKYETAFDYVMNECKVEFKGHWKNSTEGHAQSVAFMLRLLNANFMNVIQYAYIIERSFSTENLFTSVRDYFKQHSDPKKVDESPMIRVVEDLVIEALPEALTLIFLMLCTGMDHVISGELPHQLASDYFDDYFVSIPETRETKPFHYISTFDTWSFQRKNNAKVDISS